MQDKSPKGYGLMQRDREFDHYLDVEAHYHQRPSLWVEPIGKWGKGAVELVEIPTDSETNDNVVAYWISAKPLLAKQKKHFRYRLKVLNETAPMPIWAVCSIPPRAGRRCRANQPTT